AWGNIASGSELWTLTDAQTPHAITDVVSALSNRPGHGDVLANDTDPQQSKLTVSAFSDPAHGAVTVANNGIFTYTATAGFSGIDSFAYTVMNAYQVTDTAIVYIVVGDATSAAAQPTTIVTGPGISATQTITNDDFVVTVHVPAHAYSGTLGGNDLF